METREAKRSCWRDPLVVRVVGLVTLLALCWIVGNPRSAGPDEPSHMVTSAGVVRGDFSGRTVPENPALEVFVVPGMVGVPDPVCWAQQPLVPVSCAGVQPLETIDAERATTSADYAPWAFVLPGLASFVPWADGYAYLARILDSIVPIILIASGLILLTRERSATGVAALFGLTPIVWFVLGTVNPSAVAIAGGFALWAGLMVDTASLGRFVALSGWIALMLARRDGPLWATAIVISCCAVRLERPRVLWVRLGRRARWVALAVVPLAALPSVIQREFGFGLVLAAAPLGIVVLDIAMAWWSRRPDPTTTITLLVAVCFVGVLGAAMAVALRPGGFRAETLRLVMSNTGNHLEQVVGVLGWLDAPVPTTGILLYWAGLGALGAVAWLEAPRNAVVFSTALLVMIMVAWVLELGQGSEYGQYWQGRYSMPFAVGFPIVLAARRPGGASIDQFLVPIAIAGWSVGNLGFFAAQRRWGVGVDGSWYPWDWDTWGSPLPPVVLIVAHAAVSAALATAIMAHHHDVARADHVRPAP